jgi:hypothetical protein
MAARKIVYIQIILLVALAAFVYAFMLVSDRTVGGYENRQHRIVNSAIQRDLCERIIKDLDSFKSSPTTFRRTSPQTIEGETRALLRPYLRVENIPDSFPIEYTGASGKYSKCTQELSRWMQIPSTERYTQQEELAFISGESVSKYKHDSPQGSTINGGSKRIALIVGNSNYINQPLRNPINDADDMAKTLIELGFDVMVLKDASSETMRSTLDQFVIKLLQSEIGFVYLSGHGIYYNGRNYFLPVNTRFNDADEIPRFALDVSQMIERLSRAGDKLSILVIDACRNSPVVSTDRNFKQGLAAIPSKKGALIGFSTAPGTVAEDGSGRNSPYTKYLIKNLQRKGIRVEEVFRQTARDVETATAGRQVPWYSSSLLADFSLH